MRLTKFGHSCLLVEENGARVLLDPGSFSEGFEALENLTAVCLTHQHVDHLDADRLRRVLDRNPGVRVVSDEGSAEALGEAGADVEVVHDGDELALGGLALRVIGRDHAAVHPDVPVIPNVGYLVGGRLFHPGDSLTMPGEPVEVLAVPAGAPWLKLAGHGLHGAGRRPAGRPVGPGSTHGSVSRSYDCIGSAQVVDGTVGWPGAAAGRRTTSTLRGARTCVGECSPSRWRWPGCW